LFSQLQGQCKPNAESSLFAEVQPVLAFVKAKIARFSLACKLMVHFFIHLLRHVTLHATKLLQTFISCPKMNQGISKIKPRVRHLINVKEPHFLHFEA
jgi:hypothetical protein